MKIAKGRKRTVYIFDDFVVKIPIVRYRLAFSIAMWWIRHGIFWKNIIEYDHYCYGTVQIFLFRGLAENWNEFELFCKTKHCFLVPTYFSFFGLINVQKKM